MIYDCFSFFNELDLLEIRLNVLKDVVDRFVLVEAGETHTGKPKPFYFEENRSRFVDFLGRIKYVKIEKFPNGCKTAWWRENIQRNAISEGLRDAKDEDSILISDLDEIPNPEKISMWAGAPGIKRFSQDYYAFYLNYRNVRRCHWNGTQMLSYRDFCHAYDGLSFYENEFLIPELNVGTTASKIRTRSLPRSRGKTVVLRNGGWHFTCLGGASAMVAKMRAVAPHDNFNPDDPALTPERMMELILRGRGPALKMNCFAVPLDGRFPLYIRNNLEKYSHLVFPIAEDYFKSVRFAWLIRMMQGHAIDMAERLCPSSFHNFLHCLKMRIVRSKYTQ